jgi:hypothetical protein
MFPRALASLLAAGVLVASGLPASVDGTTAGSTIAADEPALS